MGENTKSSALAKHDAEIRRKALTELLKTASITFDGDGLAPLGYNASISEAEVWRKHHEEIIRRKALEEAALCVDELAITADNDLEEKYDEAIILAAAEIRRMAKRPHD